MIGAIHGEGYINIRIYSVDIDMHNYLGSICDN